MTVPLWKSENLSDLADMRLGKMLDQNKNKGTHFPYLANTNVRWGQIDLDNLREMKFEPKEFDRYGLEPGDIVMCEGGEPGRCAIWKGQTATMMIQKALHRIRVKEGVSSIFLYYTLMNKGLQGHYEGYFTGAAIKHLTGESLAKIKVTIPSLDIQQKIASILSAYDDLIENNLKRIKLLEEMAQITYEEWFVRMKFPGHEQAVIDPDTGLPEGWQYGSIGNLFEFKNGFAFKSNDYLPSAQYGIVTIKNVQHGVFGASCTDSIENLPLNLKKHHLLNSNDVIMSLTGNVGRVCLVYGKNYLLNQRVAKITPKDTIDKALSYFFFRHSTTVIYLENISNGAAQQNLSPINASKLKIQVADTQTKYLCKINLTFL